MGVSVIFNGRLYHFESDIDLDNMLERHANDRKATRECNGVKYDNELPACELSGMGGTYMM